MKREHNLHFLRACMLLPLTDREIGLLRTIAHHYGLGDQSYPEMDEDEVRALFLKCQEMMGVPQA